MKHEAAKLALPLGLLVINVGISLTFLLSGKLPDPAPAGFWIDGTVLSEAPAWVVAFRLPMIMGGLILAIGAALRWDHRFAHDERRRAGAFGPITSTFLALFCLANYHFLTAAAAGGMVMPPLQFGLTGICIFAMGNYVAKSASNGFWGLHNRWTRAHESVARRTNRLLGIIWMVEGAALVMTSPLFVKTSTWPKHDVGSYLLMALLAIILLAILPIAIAAVASARYAKEAPARQIGD